MRIAVVHEAAHPPTSSIEILYAIKDKGAEALYLRPSRISCSIVDGDIKFFYGMKELPSIDAIIVRSLGFITSLEQFIKAYLLTNCSSEVMKPNDLTIIASIDGSSFIP